VGRTATGTLGRQAEQSAFAYLRRRGLQAVARNFRSRGGEIDLIMLDKDCLAFIEVRCRASKRFTQPSHTVDHRKQQKLIRTAALFIARNKKFAATTMRFDVVAVLGLDDPDIEWIRDAFRPNSSML
tara:strand:+ start:25278 stop:25658 length:381 start_codon:yes stop_codon:yes gene_type:complete